MYAFKCGDNDRNKLKIIFNTQPKHIKFENYKKCLFSEKYQKVYNIYILRSINHDMYLQEVKKISIINFR